MYSLKDTCMLPSILGYNNLILVYLILLCVFHILLYLEWNVKNCFDKLILNS